MAAVRSPSRAEGLPRGARAADAAALGDHRRAEPIQHPTRPDAPDDLQVGQALADVATIGILHERALHRSEILAEQLQTALHNRVIIEQALGVLAERTGLHIPDVFTWLRAHARRTDCGSATSPEASSTAP